MTVVSKFEAQSGLAGTPAVTVTESGVTALFRPCQGETKGHGTLSSQSIKCVMDTVPQEDLLFEAAFLEESASWSSGGALLEESSTASSSIHLLSLGPDPSPSYELTRTYSTGPGADF